MNINRIPSTGTPAKRGLWVAAVIIAAAAIAFYYYYGGDYGRGPIVAPAAEDAATMQLSEQGSSDDTSAIEQDLGASDLSGLDQELSDIDAEFTQ